jgi:arylsulfatase A-like enzyme
VRSLPRAALIGAGLGLAVTVVESWLGAVQLLRFHMISPFVLLAKGAVFGVVLGASFGAVAAPLLGRPRGGALHLAALVVLWAAAELYASPESTTFRLFSLIGPAAGLVVFGLARRLGRGREGLTVALGVAAILAAIVVPGVWARVVAGPAAPRPAAAAAPPGAPDVVLVVLDTVRRDHVSIYGYNRPTTPSFDALAREGVLFFDAVSPASWSLPAHASLFTGRFVSSHGAHEEHRFLDPGPPTLAETLAAAGWDTRSFTANAWISDGLGLTRGFAWTDEAWRAGSIGRSFHYMYRLLDRLGFGALDKGGADVVANFERWEASRPADAPPAFTFLNFIEAHFPYHQLPADVLGRFTTLPRPELLSVSMRLFAAQFGGETVAAAAVGPAATAMYDAGVSYADSLLGRVVEAIRRRGSLDRTIVVVLADHGEMLGEHGEFGHGQSLYEPVLEVPLAIRYPPRIKPWAHVSQPVSTAGVYATILELAGLPAPPSVQVASLVPSIEGKPSMPGPVLSEQFANPLGSGDSSRELLLRGGRRYRSFRLVGWKLVLDSKGGTYLFDLGHDPGETKDIAAAQPAATARLRADLARWEGGLGLPALDAPIAAGQALPVDPAARERLRALGYVQ